MTAEDLRELRFVGDPQLSPDGSQVAYVVNRVDADDPARYRSQIMLVQFDGSCSARSLTSGRYRDSAPRWSPDGRSLAFLSDREGERSQLFVMSLEGGDPRQLTRLKHGAGAPRWSPTGDRLAFSARVDIEDIARQEGQSEEKGKQPRVKLVTRVRYKADGEGYLEAVHSQLFVVDVQTAELSQVTDGDFDAGEPAWAPDGATLAFTSNRERDRDLSLLSDVWLVSSRGGRPRRLTRHRGQAATPTFSPDGALVAFLGHERGWDYGSPTQLLVAALAGGPPAPVCASLPHEIGNAALSDVRNPSAPTPPAFLEDGRALLTMASHDGCVEVVRFDLGTGANDVVISAEEREVADFSASRDGARIAALISDPTHPYEVYACEGGQERRLTHENDAFLNSVAIMPAEPFEFTSSDGETVHGWAIKPVGFAERKKYPVLLEVHGGPEYMYAATFVHEFQVLAGRGYGVVYTNPRGSKGYGEAFTSRIFADWGNQDAADCMAAIDMVSRWRWVDSARLGVLGGSYGGFMTAWLVGHTDRFRAAVAMRGCYNFSSFYGTSDIGPWFGDYILGGPVYEREELYRARSPLTYARNIRTPLLLLHSEMDLRCPIEQAEQLFVQLRRMGKAEVELVRFPEESHNLSRSGRPDRRLERLQRIAKWFDRHL